VPSPYDPLVSQSLERLVERFAVARDTGETDAARELWGAIALKLDSRLQVYVRTFTIPNTSRRLHDDDRDDAFQRARRRVWFQLGRTFRGVSAGEVCNAARRATWFACADVARERYKREQHAHRGRRGADGSTDADIDVLSTRQATMTFERDTDRADLTDSLNRAMARMKNQSHREVLQLELLGVPDTEIAERLGISRDNVHQRRHRGLVNLRELLADAHA
jgi:RNA polymerase sigma factor (sigma-70 family)